MASSSTALGRVCVIGDSQSGRTSLIHVLEGKEFPKDIGPTNHVKISPVELSHKDQRFSLELLDLPTDPMSMSMTRQFLYRCQVAMICVDSTCSFLRNAVIAWTSECRAAKGKRPPEILIVETKCDLSSSLDSQSLEHADLQDVAAELNARLCMVSAKTGENIELLIDQTIAAGLKAIENERSSRPQRVSVMLRKPISISPSDIGGENDSVSTVSSSTNISVHHDSIMDSVPTSSSLQSDNMSIQSSISTSTSPSLASESPIPSNSAPESVDSLIDRHLSLKRKEDFNQKFQGKLYKIGGFSKNKWEQRFFLLDPNSRQLLYSKNESVEDKVRGFLPLSGAQVSLGDLNEAGGKIDKKDVYTIRVLPSDELSPKPGKAYVIGSTDKDLVDELFQRLKLIAELDLSTSSSK